MTTKPFFVATIDMYQPAGGTQQYEFAMGATPMGLFATTVEPLEDTGTLYLSDDGYTSKSTDAGGVVAYRPKIAASIGIDRQVPLEPGNGAGSWAFGSIEISDTDNEVSSLLRAWSIDAQNVAILRGEKTLENFQGYRSARQTKGWYINVDGDLTEAAAATVRWDYSTGTRTLLNEAAGTNHVANPRAAGGVAGTPGTTPTSWTISGATSGLTRSIVGLGTENGIPYIDVRWAGTASATVNANIQLVSASAVAAAVGQTWTGSSYVKLAGGTLTGVVFARIAVFDRGGSSEPSTVLVYTPTTADLAAQRKTVSRTLTVANTAYVQILHQFQFLNGGVIDVTFRIGGPQLERASAATSLILPEVGTPAVTSRDMERLYTARGIWTSPALADLVPVFTGLAGTWTATDAGVTIPIRDISYWLDRPILSAQYGGTGTYDGTADMTGMFKPKLRGKAYNIIPVLIDPTNQIYQYNDAAGTVVALYERGSTSITFQANTADLYTGTTNPGQYRTDNSRGLFQLGSAPVGQITITATGQFPTAGNKTVLADIARYLMTEDAATPTALVDTADFATAATDYPYDGGIYIGPDSGVSARDAVAWCLMSFGAKLITGRNGKARCLALRAATISETPTAAIGEYNAISVRPVNLPSALSPPPYRIRTAYQRNYTVQTDLAALATDAHREFVSKADRYAAASSTAILAAYRRPNDLPPFGGGLDDVTDAQAVADDLAALWCANRSLYTVTVPVEVGLGLDIGNTILLTWPTAFLRLGQRGVIVQEQFRSQEATTFMVLI